MTDDELLEMMRQNDESALRLLMDKYKKLVEYIAAKMLSSESDREETVMDTFYKVWANRAQIDTSRMSLKSYVSMTAGSCTVDKLRRITKGDPVDPLEDDLEMELDLENQAARSINLDIIKSCVRAMPSPDREIFIDRYYYEISVKEIAVRRGIKEKKVWNILSRRKAALQKALIKGGIMI